MSKLTEIPDLDWRGAQPSTRNLLKQILGGYVLIPVVVVLINYILRINSTKGGDPGMISAGFVLVILLAGAIGLFAEKKRYRYIYDYRISSAILQFKLTDIWGNTNEMAIPLAQIIRIKYGKRSFLGQWDRIWVQSDETVKWLVFLEPDLGSAFADQVPVEIE